MRRLEFLCVAAAMCACAATNTLASEVKVIASSSVSVAEVVEYVAQTKGAIGYVSADAIAPGVKTIEVK